MKKTNEKSASKTIKTTALNVVANMAYRHSEKMANSTCWFFDHQPKLPQSVKELKEHK